MGDTRKLAIANGETLAGHYPADTDWYAPLEKSTLIELFDRAIFEHGHRPCIDFFGRKLNYLELGNLVNRAAKGLQAQGIGKGSKVGLSMPNSPYYPVMMFAALKTGATVVNYNPTYAEDKLRQLIKDSGTEIMVTLDLNASYPQIEKLVREGHLQKAIVCPMGNMMPGLTSFMFRHFSGKKANPVFGENIVDYRSIAANDGRYAPVKIEPDDLAVLQYTGGTTGMPKAAMLTHNNLAVNAAQILSFFKALRPGKEKIMGVLPFFHVFGLQISMITSLKLGAEMIAVPDPRDIKNLLKTMERTKATFLPTVPRLLQAISEFKNRTWWGKTIDAKHFDLASLRLAISGGDALRANVERDFTEKTGCRIVQGYGLSETSPVATIQPPGNVKPGTIGLPVARTEIRIALPDKPEQAVFIGEVGEICIRGPQVMTGYFNDAAQTAEVMTKDGFFRTRDLGVMGEDMVTSITGRLKRMIIINGLKVYAEEIEDKIALHPSIAESCVIKVMDDRSGEAVKVFIRYKPEAQDRPTAEQLKEFLSKYLNGTQMPKFIEFSEKELAKTDVGKPNYKYYEDLERQKYEESKKTPALVPA